ncbi:MAG: CDP-alcohol phosphatidyltransferase family protein [Flavobacteriales bacterium]|nr:CDP-alcohol phosphatidyltransferase family protein [Flavobacteriales bacterium]
MKRHIPNLLTLSNLFCGILAVKSGFEGEFFLAAGLVVLGAIFDFFDGFAARLLKVSNEIGKQLDSLSDMVTFGVAPGVIMFTLLNIIFKQYDAQVLLAEYIPYIAFVIPLASAVRLAKFNVDENQSDKFIGVPTPANSLFFIAIPLIYMEYIKNSLPPLYLGSILILLILIFSWLLNANIELLALKFKTFGWKNNEIRYTFIGMTIITIILTIFLKIVYISIPIIILLYIIISIINNSNKKQIE